MGIPLLIGTVLALSLQLCSASMMKAGDTTVKLIASGGKIEIAMGGSMVSMRLAKVQEMINATAMVTENSTHEHMYSDFGASTFTVGTATMKNASGAEPAHTVNDLTLELAFKNNVTATMKFNVLIAHGNGTINLGGEDFAFVDQMVAAMFKVSDWKFCKSNDDKHTCYENDAKQDGKFLDVAFELSGKGNGKPSGNATNSFVLGPAAVHYTDQYIKDDASTATAMPDGYPKLPTTTVTHFTIRTGLFDVSAEYGPVRIVLAKSTTSGAAKVSAGLATVFAILSVLLLR